LEILVFTFFLNNRWGSNTVLLGKTNINRNLLYNIGMETELTYRQKYYLENKERMKQQATLYYQNNKETCLLYQKEYNDKNKNYIATRHRNYILTRGSDEKRERQKLITTKTISRKSKIEAFPKPPKRAVIEIKRKKIEKTLAEIQRRADAFRASLNQSATDHNSTNEKI